MVHLRKLMALFLVTVLAVGCAKSKNEPEEQPKPAAEDAVLTVFYLKQSPLPLSVLHEVTRSFGAKYPNIQVQVQELEETPYKRDGSIDLERIADFDLYVLDPGLAAALYRESVVRDLNQVTLPAWDPQVEHIAGSVGYWDGDRVFVPLLVTYTQMVYEPKRFELAGMPKPTADWTYDDLEGAAQQLRAAGQRAEFLYSALLPAMAVAYGVEFSEVGDRWQIDTPEHRQVLLKVRQWVDEGLVPFPHTAIKPTWVGDNALALSDMWLRSVAPAGYEFTPHPKGPAGRRSTVSTTGLAVGAGSQHPEAAVLFVQEFMNAGWIALARAGHRPLVNDPVAMQTWRETLGPEKAAVVDDVLGDAIVAANAGPTIAITGSIAYRRKVEEYLGGSISLDELIAQLESMEF